MSIEVFDCENFFFDLDGVIWEREQLLPGALAFIKRLESSGKRIYYVTNNAMRDRQSFCILLTQLGLPVNIENFICAAYSCASYLKTKYNENDYVYVLGCSGLTNEIKKAGFNVISAVSMEDTHLDTNELGNIQVHPEIKAVVVGFTYKLNFCMLTYAVNCISQGAELVTGEYDKCDKYGKYNVPGSACTVDYLKHAIKCPIVNVGKPERFIIDRIIERDSLCREKCIMFGDKMNTDIMLGKNSGIKTVLMLTGVETEKSYRKYDFTPDVVLKTFEDILSSD